MKSKDATQDGLVAFTARIPKSMVDALKVRSDRTRLSKSDHIRLAIAEYLGAA